MCSGSLIDSRVKDVSGNSGQGSSGKVLMAAGVGDGGGCKEAMGRGDKLLSDSGGQWAGSGWRPAVMREGDFIPFSALFCPFHSLNPFTSYKLRVKATNDIGDSDFSAETEAVTTLQDGKGGGGEARWGLPRAPGATAGCSPWRLE